MKNEKNLEDKDIELTKKLAMIGWLKRNGHITENEYLKVKRKLMNEYNIVCF